MFHYFVTSGNVLIPVDDFLTVKKDVQIIDSTTAKIHLEYPNVILMDTILNIDGADITINRELVQNSDGDYVLKEEI